MLRMMGIGATGLLLTLVGCGGQAEESTRINSDEATPAPVVEAAYPLDVCVVSGSKLGSMGESVSVEIQGRTVKLCCAGCIDQLRSEPERYLSKLDDAASQRDR